MAGIYVADIYCDDCVDCIKRDIAVDLFENRNPSHLIDWSEVDTVEDVIDQLDNLDERDYDSDEYPKYCSDSEESDCPQHCGSGANCINAIELSSGHKIGYFFGNDLTAEGDDYVMEAFRDARNGGGDSEVADLWAECYDYLDFKEYIVCNLCGNESDEVNEDNICEDCTMQPMYDDFTPQPMYDDFTITPCGRLGGKSALGRVEGKFVGEFDSDDAAVVAAKSIMEDEKFYTNIWMVSDHGNWSLLTE